MLKIDFGCGPKLLEGWVGCDVRAAHQNTRFLCNAWEIIDQVKPGECEAVRSRHFLEHVSAENAHRTVAAWHTILRSGGLCQVIVPDLDYALWQLAPERADLPSAWSRRYTNREHAMATLYGWQKDVSWDVHLWAYSKASLSKLMTQHGFSLVNFIDERPWEINSFWRT